MVEEDRAITSAVFVSSMIATIVVATVDGIADGGRTALIILLVIIQMAAYFWYTISYIPFARTAVKNCCMSMCGGASG